MFTFYGRRNVKGTPGDTPRGLPTRPLGTPPDPRDDGEGEAYESASILYRDSFAPKYSEPFRLTEAFTPPQPRPIIMPSRSDSPEDVYMSAIDRFSSLDDTMRQIREDHARELQSCRDTTLAAQLEAEMAKAQLKTALLDRDTYMRLATKLIAQFSTVEKVFAEAKQLAIEYATSQPPPPPTPEAPTITLENPPQPPTADPSTAAVEEALKGPEEAPQ